MRNAKRLKLFNQNEDYTEQTGRSTGNYQRINCEYCDLEITYGNRWSHLTQHQQGLNQFGMRTSLTRSNGSMACFPWYMHSVYQDRSVNRSRYEAIQFTELTRVSQTYDFEKRIAKPITTHFWINYSGEKTGDKVKDFFGLRPYTIDYNIYDNFEVRDRDKDDCGNFTGAAPQFGCSICQKSIRRCTTVIQTVMSILVHVLSEHSDQKDIHRAAFEDMREIQKATGIRTYLEEVPNYNPVLAHDILFDSYYSRDIFASITNKGSVLSTYCLLCFAEVPCMGSYKFSNKHSIKVHGLKIGHALGRFDCISSERYGHSTSIGCKNQSIPLMLVRDEDLSSFSWACFGCNLTMKHADSTQLIIYIAAHLTNNDGMCQDKIGTGMTKKNMESNAFKYINDLFSRLNQCKTIITSWDKRLEPVTLQAVNDDFLKISFDKFLKKWISHLTIGPNTDHVELCSNLIPYKPVYTGKKRTRKSMPEFIHICPFCLSYFLNSFGAFLHLQPDECAEMKFFHIQLDPEDLKTAHENKVSLKSK